MNRAFSAAFWHVLFLWALPQAASEHRAFGAKHKRTKAGSSSGGRTGNLRPINRVNIRSGRRSLLVSLPQLIKCQITHASLRD